MKALRNTLIIVAILVVIAIGVIYFVIANLDAIVEAAIEKYGSQATQTAVRVDGVKIELKEGEGTIAGLTVANPPGFTTPYILSLGQISAGLDLASVGEDTIYVDSVLIKSPEVTYEINKDRQSNVKVLSHNLSSGSTEPAKKKPAEEGESGPKVVIRRLVIEEGRVNAKVSPQIAKISDKDMSAKLPRIELTNLGAGGALPEAIARRVTDAILKSARNAVADLNLDQYVDQAVDKAKDKAREEARKKIDEKLGEDLGDKLREKLGN
jgi:hypothetical protein